MRRRDFLPAAPVLGPVLAPLLVTASGWARAETFPRKPIRYIVPVAPGGGNDMIARTVTGRWGKVLGQPFVVENIGGGEGVVACRSTMRAAPDGYTKYAACE